MIFGLCYILLLHQTTTLILIFAEPYSCVISFFYIKPQLDEVAKRCRSVVLYPSSTSNHNKKLATLSRVWLCYILLLHQTTTFFMLSSFLISCVISFFYIKPQLPPHSSNNQTCCVISFFYIKPQRGRYFTYTRSSCVISFFYIKPQLGSQ